MFPRIYKYNIKFNGFLKVKFKEILKNLPLNNKVFYFFFNQNKKVYVTLTSNNFNKNIHHLKIWVNIFSETIWKKKQVIRHMQAIYVDKNHRAIKFLSTKHESYLLYKYHIVKVSSECGNIIDKNIRIVLRFALNRSYYNIWFEKVGNESIIYNVLYKI